MLTTIQTLQAIWVLSCISRLLQHLTKPVEFFTQRRYSELEAGVFLLSMHKISTYIPIWNTYAPLPYTVRCKGNSKEGFATSSGFLPSITRINTGAAKSKTSRGKQYGQWKDLQRQSHSTLQNKLLFCLHPVLSYLHILSCMHLAFHKALNAASHSQGFLSEACEGLEQEHMLVFTYFPFFLNEGWQMLPLCLHMTWLLSPGQKPFSLPLLVVAPTQTELRTSAHRQLPWEYSYITYKYDM